MSIHNTAGANAIIARLGRDCDILRATVTGADSYRNDTKEWKKVGTERVARIYPYLRQWPNQIDSLSGEIDTDNPILLARRDADIQDGDKVLYDGTEYRVRTPIQMQTHLRLKTQAI